MAMVVVVRNRGDGLSTHKLVSKGPIYPVGDSLQFIDPCGRMHSIPARDVLEIHERAEGEQ